MHSITHVLTSYFILTFSKNCWQHLKYVVKYEQMLLIFIKCCGITHMGYTQHLIKYHEKNINNIYSCSIIFLKCYEKFLTNFFTEVLGQKMLLKITCELVTIA